MIYLCRHRRLVTASTLCRNLSSFQMSMITSALDDAMMVIYLMISGSARRVRGVLSLCDLSEASINGDEVPISTNK